MTTQRHLIVNADDFGQSHGVNCGIIEAYEKGIVTSASLMVRRPAAEEAATYGREHPELSIGLHLDLCEWIYRDETWSPLYEVVPIDDAFAIAEEVNRQLMTFRRLESHQLTINFFGYCKGIIYGNHFVQRRPGLISINPFTQIKVKANAE